jgi:acyl-coenzyme A synthetase/AMP-(fatty) acid ligase
MSLVRPRKSPITGALVVADVVLREQPDGARLAELQGEILRRCNESLTRYKVPTAIRFVPALAIAETGKLARQHA